MVTLYVGESQKPFYVHLDLLCDVSSFFKAAFAGSFREGVDKTMQLPEDNENTLLLFLDWLYYRRYEMMPESDYDESDDEADDEDESDDEIDEELDEDDKFLEAFRLFVLAEKYDVPSLKRLVVEKLFANTGEYHYGPRYSSVLYLYAHTTKSSGIRRLVADWHAWYMDPVHIELPRFQALLRKQPDFSAEVMLSFAKNRKRGTDYDPFAGEMLEEYTR